MRCGRIGIALDVPGNRMSVTGLGGSLYSAKLDGSEKRVLLYAQGNLAGVAYAEITSSEVAVIGIKGDKWGERPLALVVRDVQTGDDLSDTQIKAHLKVLADPGVISKYGIPDKSLFVEALPRTSVGKFDKKELRQEYGNPG